MAVLSIRALSIWTVDKLDEAAGLDYTALGRSWPPSAGAACAMCLGRSRAEGHANSSSPEEHLVKGTVLAWAGRYPAYMYGDELKVEGSSEPHP